MHNTVMLLFFQHGASQQDFLKAEVSQSVKDTAYDFASLANAHLQKVPVNITQTNICVEQFLTIS